MNKKAIEDLLLSIEIENPLFKITRVYPGPMDTDFVRNTNYKGISIFKKIDTGWWAKKIVNSKKSLIINKKDFIILLIDSLLPFKLKKWLYTVLFS